MKHLQTDGQAKVANHVIVRGLKRRLEETSGNLVDKLSHVIWDTKSFISFAVWDKQPISIEGSGRGVLPKRIVKAGHKCLSLFAYLPRFTTLPRYFLYPTKAGRSWWFFLLRPFEDVDIAKGALASCTSTVRAT